jgi:hypothetical protein
MNIGLRDMSQNLGQKEQNPSDFLPKRITECSPYRATELRVADQYAAVRPPVPLGRLSS